MQIVVNNYLELDTEQRIVGGIPADPGEFPDIVYLQVALGRSFCGGTILYSNMILTAAHCVLGSYPSDGYYAAAGALDQLFYSNVYFQRIRVWKVIRHGGYNE